MSLPARPSTCTTWQVGHISHLDRIEEKTVEDPKRAATRARIAAENAATEEIERWRRGEMAAIAADTSLTAADIQRRKMEVLMEVGKRAKRAHAKARRDNTAAKVLERELLERHRERYGR